MGGGPPGESRVERLIREAEERGDFDDLPGRGKPLDLRGLDDPDWWAKQKIRDEGLDSAALLPPNLALRRERQELPEVLAELSDETAVREQIDDFNRRVRRSHLRALDGPAAHLIAATVDVEETVAAWRSARLNRR